MTLTHAVYGESLNVDYVNFFSHGAMLMLYKPSTSETGTLVNVKRCPSAAGIV